MAQETPLALIIGVKQNRGHGSVICMSRFLHGYPTFGIGYLCLLDGYGESFLIIHGGDGDGADSIWRIGGYKSMKCGMG